MKNVFLLFATSLVVWISGCSSIEKRNNTYSNPDQNKALVDEKYSLTADRKKIDELRSTVPAEKKKENDELALILQLTGEVKKSPSDVRNEFDKVVRKKREIFDKDMTKERDQFTKDEKKSRDQFLKSQSDSRDKFQASKHNKDENSDFYKDSESRRQEYFANEREKRNDFESDTRDKRKNFEDYIHEKNNEFNQEYRAYSRRYDDMKKQEREEKALKQKAEFDKMGSANATGVASPGVTPFNPEINDLDREIEEAKKRAGSPLGTGE